MLVTNDNGLLIWSLCIDVKVNSEKHTEKHNHTSSRDVPDIRFRFTGYPATLSNPVLAKTVQGIGLPDILAR